MKIILLIILISINFLTRAQLADEYTVGVLPSDYTSLRNICLDLISQGTTDTVVVIIKPGVYDEGHAFQSIDSDFPIIFESLNQGASSVVISESISAYTEIYNPSHLTFRYVTFNNI